MPVALLFIGVLFLVAAVRGEHKLFFELIKSDFTGPNNFIFWALSIFLIGAIGYYQPARRLSDAFMLLVVLVLFLSNRGFFNKFMATLGQTTTSSRAGDKIYDFATQTLKG